MALTCNCQYQPNNGVQPWSLTRKTRNGVKMFEVSWHFKCHARFATKREATAWIDAHRDNDHAGWLALKA